MLRDAFGKPKNKICAKDHNRERVPTQAADGRDIIDEDIATTIIGMIGMNECMNGCMQRTQCM